MAEIRSDDINENTDPVPAPASSRAPVAGPGRAPSNALGHRPPLAEHVLDLIALLALIALTAVVFAAAGPEAFAVVASVGAGLFMTWRGRNERL